MSVYSGLESLNVSYLRMATVKLKKKPHRCSHGNVKLHDRLRQQNQKMHTSRRRSSLLPRSQSTQRQKFTRFLNPQFFCLPTPRVSLQMKTAVDRRGIAPLLLLPPHFPLPFPSLSHLSPKR